MKEICVVAPIYNEAPSIREFVKQVSDVLVSINDNYQIILVDDGSKDNSWEIIKDESMRNHKIKAIKLSRNFGHHYAITAGIHKSNSKWTVVMDSDLQDRPVVIKDLYRKAVEGYDVVFVSRSNRPESFWYIAAQKLFYKLLNATSGLKFNSKQANFSIINSKVVEAFKGFNEFSRFYGSTIRWLGFESANIIADHGVRFKGKPTYTLRKRFKLAFDIVLAFSDRPLKLAILLSLVTSFSVLALGLFFSAGVLLSSPDSIVRGLLPFLIMGLAVLCFMLFTVFGMYLLSIFHEVKKRPLFVISDEIN
jgi:glycosyltransferase involved in cell wall biosynthesis